MKPGGDPGWVAEDFARRLCALENGPIRYRAAARGLAFAPVETSLELLEALARDDGLPARLALAAVARALLEPPTDLSLAFRADLFEAARRKGSEEILALLVAPAPVSEFREPLDKPDPHLSHLTLGHKKVFARAHRDPDLLARLAAEGDPRVVRELLQNPQLTEPFVVRMAARRPCRPATLRCIFESPRWRDRRMVVLAIVRNPYAEPELALKLLPSLSPPDLADIARERNVHPLVRGFAERLSERSHGSRERLAALGPPGALPATYFSPAFDETTQRVAKRRDTKRDDHEESDEKNDEADVHHDERT